MHEIPIGALTAVITPFTEEKKICWDGLKRLVEFQISQGVSGIVPTGTTGESPTLTESEHMSVLSQAITWTKDTFVLFGCGSNCTAEAMDYVAMVDRNGGKAVLLVDPYYNGPSSLEIRREYYEPIARAFPDVAIIPYIIPGRTGCALLPEDLAILNKVFLNVCAAKEATGDFARMALIRSLTQPSFQIFSGDDDKTFRMMTDPEIDASGVISVISNIAPQAVQQMCKAIIRGDIADAQDIRDKLRPLFGIVTVSTPRMTLDSSAVIDKFRNPLPIKTAMNLLGMPAGPCRQPLGKMSANGAQKVREALATVWAYSPDILSPIEEFFKVSISQRLTDANLFAKLSY